MAKHPTARHLRYFFEHVAESRRREYAAGTRRRQQVLMGEESALVSALDYENEAIFETEQHWVYLRMRAMNS